MKALVDGGLVIARRGAKGGYRIARPPAQISIRDVVEAFEGPIALTECSQGHNVCDITDTCNLSDVDDVNLIQLCRYIFSHLLLDVKLLLLPYVCRTLT